MYSVVLMMALGTGADATACHKTCGGCYSYACSGCYGCSGCWGYSCGGCWGCSGKGCFGGGLFRGKGCHCSCYGGCYGCTGYYGCCGCTGYYTCGGYYGCNGIGCAGYGVAPVAPVTPVKPEPAPAPAPKEVSAPATIVVTLPADAKLTIDGAATSSTSARRTFVSPTLPAGQEFGYTLQAEIVRDGKTVKVTKQVTVRAGEETTVSFEEPASVVSR